MKLNPTSLMTKATEQAKPEKTQEELRVALKSRLNSLKPTLKHGIQEYQQALEDGTFEDQEGEAEGSGETRKQEMQKNLTYILDQAEKMKKRLDSLEPLPQITPDISVRYTHPDKSVEIIKLDFEAKLQEYLDFYQLTKIDLPPDFADTVRDIWERNQTDIEQAIEENGFDDLLIIPGNIPLTELKDKMKMTMEDAYLESDNFKAGGSFASAVSQNVDKSRLILIHKTQNLRDRPELQQTLNIKGKDVKLDQALTLEDYLIFKRKYFAETGKHLDEDGWIWLATKSGVRLVCSLWRSGHIQLLVRANDLERQNAALGVRLARTFF
ncbi:MAG TPA: hypothetical protein PLH37_03635 [bacterium]|nr:hypothetical protein [bacterium]